MRDIPYLKFMEFSTQIAERANDLVFIADKVIEHFYPEVKSHEALYVEEFSMALNKDVKKPMPYILSLQKINKTGAFIDSVNYSEAKDFGNVLQIILRPWYWFGKVNVDKINLSDGNRIMKSFLTESVKLGSLTNIFITRQYRFQTQR